MIAEERLAVLIANATERDGYVQPWQLARAVEREAYEAAAKVCDGMTGRRPWECAAAIRALKEKTGAE